MYTHHAGGSFRFEIHEAGSALRREAIGVSFVVDELYTGAFELAGEGEHPLPPTR